MLSGPSVNPSYTAYRLPPSRKQWGRTENVCICLWGSPLFLLCRHTHYTWLCVVIVGHSVQSLSRVHSLQPCGLQHARLPCPSPTLRACLNSRPSSWWCQILDIDLIHNTKCFRTCAVSLFLQGRNNTGHWPLNVDWVDEWLFQLWALSSDPRAHDSQNILHGGYQKFQCIHVF